MDLAGRAVVDRAGRRGRLTDLAIDLLGGAYPPVAILLVAVQVLNALLLPVLRIVAWATAVTVSLLALTMLANLGAEALGLDLFALFA